MTKSIFENRSSKSNEKKLSVPIPPELDSQISAIKTELKMKAPEMQYNTTNICVEALTKAARRARKELDQM